MWQQISLGSALVLATTAAHGVGTFAAMFGLTRVQRFNRTHLGRGFVISALVLVMLLVSVLEAVLWAYAYVDAGDPRQLRSDLRGEVASVGIAACRPQISVACHGRHGPDALCDLGEVCWRGMTQVSEREAPRPLFADRQGRGLSERPAVVAAAEDEATRTTAANLNRCEV